MSDTKDYRMGREIVVWVTGTVRADSMESAVRAALLGEEVDWEFDHTDAIPTDEGMGPDVVIYDDEPQAPEEEINARAYAENNSLVLYQCHRCGADMTIDDKAAVSWPKIMDQPHRYRHALEKDCQDKETDE